ncbi:DnaD domain protein [Gracilibacillus caseinilyticus]|uniref:DnaD domain protein n=1 Tax=Gracilibacillus caseinilyticus TaxID=2932256 RepID=A0ABY4F164_9BACI|nr:DnaD domain protein [Gracilibacillus caseinilyticus]UOQ49634.1 DnaD domain protein [Gracilibacillus caseinilyticus]
MLFAAMKIAAKAEAKGVKYMERVLVNWTEAGVESLEDVRRLDQQAKKRQRTKPYQQKPGSNKRDIVPDWYVKHKGQRSVKSESAKTEEEKRRSADEMDRLLAAYLAGQE